MRRNEQRMARLNCDAHFMNTKCEASYNIEGMAPEIQQSNLYRRDGTPGKIHSLSIASYKDGYGEASPYRLHKGLRRTMNYTYMVRCRDDSLYTGWTNHLEKRVEDHNSGRGAKYTKSRRPVELVYYEQFETKEEAMRREWEIKQLTRKQKEKLLEQAGQH